MEFDNMFPLHKACNDGNVQNVVNLLDANKYLSVTEDNFKNWSPIHWAAFSGHLDCLRQVVSCEPSCLNLQSSKTFQTPLHCAAEGKQPHCVLWLLQAGVNPEVKDNFGETALHKASKVGCAECVGLFISTTTNICAQNNDGLTASMLADISGYPHIACFIRQKEMTRINVFQNRCNIMESLPVGPRLNRKRGRDMSEFDNPFKRQRSIDLNEMVLSSTPMLININPIHSSAMEHEDLCGSELQYSNSLYESMLREFHGC